MLFGNCICIFTTAKIQKILLRNPFFYNLAIKQKKRGRNISTSAGEIGQKVRKIGL
jgi:hypothetical protein